MSEFVRNLAFTALVCMGCAFTGSAQDAAPQDEATAAPTKTFLMARTGESLETPHLAIIHYLEFFQIRRKWIVPDVGYVDFGHGNYREFFVGGGRTLYDGNFPPGIRNCCFFEPRAPPHETLVTCSHGPCCAFASLRN